MLNTKYLVTMKFVIISTFLICLFSVSASAQKIKASHNNNEVSSEIELSWTKQANAANPNELQYKANIRFRVNRQKQPVKHRGFVVSEPYVETIKYTLNKTGYQPFQKPLSTKPNSIHTHSFIDVVSSDKVAIAINSVSVIYSQKQLHTREYIDGYYQSKQKLDNIINELSTLRFKNPYTLEQKGETLNLIERKLNRINDKNYDRKLPLHSYDPINFKSMSAKANQLFQEKDRRYHNRLESHHMMYYRYAMQAYSERDKIDAFNRAIDKAHQKGIHFADPFYQLALIEYNHYNYKACLEHLHNVMCESPSHSVMNEAVALYSTIYQQFMEKGRRTRGQAAIDWYYMALEVCRDEHVPINCDEAFRLVVAERTAIFSAMVDEAVARNDFNMMVEAQNYQTRFYNEISNPEKISIGFQHLYENIIQSASRHTQSRQYSQALSELNGLDAKELQYGVRLENRSGYMNVYQQLYNSLINEANQALQSKRYEDALEYTSLANQIITSKSFINGSAEEIENLFAEIYGGVFNHRLDKIYAQISNKQFSSALSALTDLRGFVNQNSRYFVDQAYTEIDRATQKCYSDELAYKLSLIDRQISSAKYFDAKREMLSIYAFINSNGKWFNDNDHASVVAKNEYLTNKLIYQGERKNNANRYTDAIQYFDAATELNAKLNNQTVADKIANGHFAANFGLAIQYKNRKDYTAALQYIDKANGYDCPLRNQKYQQLKQEEQNCASALINQKIFLAEQDISANKLKTFPLSLINSLKKVLSEINEITYNRNYQLNQSQNSKLQSIREKIFKEECKIAQERFDKKMNSARAEIRAKSYVRGVELLEQAVEISKEMYQCGISTFECIVLIKKYRPGAEYQNLKSKINSSIEFGKYDIALNDYAIMEKQFNDDNVAQLGLTHTPINTFISNHSNNLWVRYCAIALSNKEVNLGFVNQLIGILFNKNLEKYFYKEFGLMIGKENKTKFKGQHYKTVVTRYSLPETKNAKQFKKGFKKGMK